ERRRDGRDGWGRRCLPARPTSRLVLELDAGDAHSVAWLDARSLESRIHTKPIELRLKAGEAAFRVEVRPFHEALHALAVDDASRWLLFDHQIAAGAGRELYCFG